MTGIPSIKGLTSMRSGIMKAQRQADKVQEQINEMESEVLHGIRQFRNSQEQEAFEEYTRNLKEKCCEIREINLEEL